ncbi:hypothetical protein BGW38_010981 [Lunasporangiospora selenospora]|uniref:Uncharacterized protein n=1 Tax=Lunasporangiospora selenospora TaxID=979761 RepID=A0A9P6KEI8_9FUNG|nr:hypothetical protein BGW38_010981 [Lunasporangiospora selenospora]
MAHPGHSIVSASTLPAQPPFFPILERADQSTDASATTPVGAAPRKRDLPRNGAGLWFPPQGATLYPLERLAELAPLPNLGSDNDGPVAIKSKASLSISGNSNEDNGISVDKDTTKTEKSPNSTLRTTPKLNPNITIVSMPLQDMNADTVSLQ